MPDNCRIGSSHIVRFYQALPVHALHCKARFYSAECRCVCHETHLLRDRKQSADASVASHIYYSIVDVSLPTILPRVSGWFSGWCRYYLKRTRRNPHCMLHCTYVLLHQNPHNVGKWPKRYSLYLTLTSLRYEDASNEETVQPLPLRLVTQRRLPYLSLLR